MHLSRLIKSTPLFSTRIRSAKCCEAGEVGGHVMRGGIEFASGVVWCLQWGNGIERTMWIERTKPFEALKHYFILH